MSQSLVRALLGRDAHAGLFRTLDRARSFALFAEHADVAQWRMFRNAAVSKGGPPLRQVETDEISTDTGTLTNRDVRETSVAG